MLRNPFNISHVHIRVQLLVAAEELSGRLYPDTAFLSASSGFRVYGNLPSFELLPAGHQSPGSVGRDYREITIRLQCTKNCKVIVLTQN